MRFYFLARLIPGMGWRRDPYSPESECVAEEEDDDDADQDGRGLLCAALERHGPLMEVGSTTY